MWRSLMTAIALAITTLHLPAQKPLDAKSLNAIVQRLFEVSGYTGMACPLVKVVAEKRQGAGYFPAQHEIRIEEALLKACRELGPDSLNAAAYVLGHELTHAFHKDIQLGRGLVENDFLAYGESFPERQKLEYTADFQGVFLASLAGYRVGTAVPEVIERIYKEYQLEDKKLPAYPSLAKRRGIAKEVLAQGQKLYGLFQSANILTGCEHYELANMIYAYIGGFYPSPEIRNNRAVAYCLEAMKTFPVENDKYLLPLELDLNSRLRKFQKARGALDPRAAQDRQRMLEKALSLVNEALEQDPGYAIARTNRSCILNLLGRHVEALENMETHQAKFQSEEIREKADHLKAVSLVFGGQEDMARQIWNRLSFSRYEWPREAAQYNLAVLSGRNYAPWANNTCNLPAEFLFFMPDLKLGALPEAGWEHEMVDGKEFSYNLQTGPDFLTASFEVGGSRVSLKRFNPPLGNFQLEGMDEFRNSSAVRWVPVGKNIFISCEQESFVMEVDPMHNLRSLSKIYE